MKDFTAALLVLSVACHHAPVEPPAVTIHTVEVRRGCLHDEAPTVPAAAFAPVVGAACAPWAACYDQRNAVALAWYLDELERWQHAAIIDCSEPPADAGKGATP